MRNLIAMSNDQLDLAFNNSTRHVILVSAQVLLILTLGLWTSDLGLTILKTREQRQSSKTLKDQVFDAFYLDLEKC